MEKRLVTPIPPDYDLILYYYNSLKNGIIPSYNSETLHGMYIYLENNRDTFDSLLESMLDYVVKRLLNI